MRILLLAFEAFGTLPTNPAWLAAQHCTPPTSVHLERRSLHVAYAAADQAAERIVYEEWDLILLLGVRAGASHIAIERLAINRHDTVHPDTAGTTPTSSTITTTRDLVRTTALPVDDLANNLRTHGIPVTVSTDPGTYLCNYTYYQLRPGNTETRPPHTLPTDNRPRQERRTPTTCTATRVPHHSAQHDTHVPGVAAFNTRPVASPSPASRCTPPWSKRTLQPPTPSVATSKRSAPLPRPTAVHAYDHLPPVRTGLRPA